MSDIEKTHGENDAAVSLHTQTAYQYPAPIPSKRKLGTATTLAIIGVAIVVVIVLVIGVAFSVYRGAVALRSLSYGSSPSEVVTAYLTAIADGDADAALAFLDWVPDKMSLLTDDVLATSNALAPITEIDVAEATGVNGSADVTATYVVGGETITTTFSTIDHHDDGRWEVSDGTSYIYTAPFEGLGLTINGQEINADDVEGYGIDVFPGTYELATTMPKFVLSGESIVMATDTYGAADTTNIEPVLTEEALQEFRGLVRESVNACIASTTLAAGCGLDLAATTSDGTQLIDGTITRTLDAATNATIDSVEARPIFGNPTLVEGGFIGSPSIEADCTKNGTTGRCSIDFAVALGTPSVDMTADNPAVIWD